jgi:hypothetical protein
LDLIRNFDTLARRHYLISGTYSYVMPFDRSVFTVSTAAVLVIAIFAMANIFPLAVFAESNLVDRPKHLLLPSISIYTLSPDNRELAEQLEIWPMLTELYDRNNHPNKERRTVLRQKIRETILESHFDAASVQAEAEREQGIIETQRETLITKRDRDIQLNNATNFIASGTLNTIGSILGFSKSAPPFPGNLNQMLSGVVAAGMSTYSLKQQSGGKTRGQGHPTVIAELFGRPCDERTVYPESVWRFIHGRAPDSDKTRAQLLEEHWITRNHLEKHGSHRESLKLDLVSGIAIDKKCMTLDDLNDQISMISDISVIASLMSHHLRDLISLIDSDIVELAE